MAKKIISFILLGVIIITQFACTAQESITPAPSPGEESTEMTGGTQPQPVFRV